MIVRAGERYASEAKSASMGYDPTVVSSFMKCVDACSHSVYTDRREDPASAGGKLLTLEGRSVGRPKRGLDVFVSDRYIDIASEGGTLKRARLNEERG